MISFIFLHVELVKMCLYIYYLHFFLAFCFVLFFFFIPYLPIHQCKFLVCLQVFGKKQCSVLMCFRFSSLVRKFAYADCTLATRPLVWFTVILNCLKRKWLVFFCELTQVNIFRCTLSGVVTIIYSVLLSLLQQVVTTDIPFCIWYRWMDFLIYMKKLETTKALTQIFHIIGVKAKSYNHPQSSLCKAAYFFYSSGMQLNPFTRYFDLLF